MTVTRSVPSDSQYRWLGRLPLDRDEVMAGGRKRRSVLSLQRRGWAEWEHAELKLTEAGRAAMERYWDRRAKRF
jgi:hypothetical protein